jgi:Uma2 family endonuclease
MQWFATGEDFGMLSVWDASRDVGVFWYNWQIGGIVFSAPQRMEERRMTTTGMQRMTLEELRALSEGPPYYEYEEGELILVASYTAEHQDIVGALAYLFRQFVRQHRLGRVVMEVDVYLPDGRGYIPDLAYLATEQLHLLNPTDHKIHGSPDLVVEVTSSTPARDRVHKFRVYYVNGVPWYWIIDSNTLAIEEYHATPQGYLRVASVAAGEEFRPQLFPGLVVNLVGLLGVEPPDSPPA